ncbi:MAG: DUF6020 family protein [Clostridiales bacterium]|nr:DUF6020 family protein [Clostridiales bacterium]
MLLAAASGIGAFLSVYAIDLHFFLDRDGGYTYSIIHGALFLLIFAAIHKAAKKNAPRVKAVSAVCAAVFSLIIVIGDSIAHTNDLSYLETVIGAFGVFVSLAGFWFLFFACLVNLFDCLDRLCVSQMLPVNKERPYFFTDNKASVLFAWTLIFLAWLPCFFTYYPGIMSYDVQSQMLQISTGAYTSQHSILHTAFLHGVLLLGDALGDYYQALAIFIIAQMLAVSLFFSLCIYYLAKIDTGTGVRVVALLYYMLSPMMAVFSIITTKDVFFGGFFLASVILVFDMIRAPAAFFSSPLRLCLLSAAIFMACMFRNNAPYVYGIFFIFAIVHYRKHIMRLLYLCIVILVVFVTLVCIEGPLYNVNDVETESGKAALLCVPLVQLASVAKNNADEMEPGQLAGIKKYIDPEGYNPRFADPVLHTFETSHYDKDSRAFFSLWLSLAKKFPAEYANAFLSLNLAYWYPDLDPLDPSSQWVYIETTMKDVTEFYPQMSVKRQSLIPALLPAYESFSREASHKEYPVTATFFSLALPFWLLVLCSAFCIIKRKPRFLLVLLLPFLLWLTHMLGPVANVRYMYALFVLYPVFAAMLFDGNCWVDKAVCAEESDPGQGAPRTSISQAG